MFVLLRRTIALVAGLLFLHSGIAGASEPDPHQALYGESAYPSATQCAGCHKQHYEEWSRSAHAYSAVSPMFHKFEQTINGLAPSLGGFCVRCHASVGSSLGESRAIDLWKRSAVGREGVTCVTCHRVSTEYGKVNGERRIDPGEIFAPVYGAKNGPELANVISNKEFYKVATAKEEKGKRIHLAAVPMEQLQRSEFCASCHQVAVNLGIKLEVVWDQYRASPAHAQGISCQQCHMGKVPGKAEGYETGPVAVIEGKPIEPQREHHNHAFYGPGYSIAHPGVFPHNSKAQRWSVEDWLGFDFRAQWGSEAFERRVEDGLIDIEFPEAWAEPADREEAWAIIQENLGKLAIKQQERAAVMDNGLSLSGPFFPSTLQVGSDLKFNYLVNNINPGHNVPSGSLGAQPELWMNVALINPAGVRIWESGYVDSNGDMADLHSLDVRNGSIAHDDQLFNLQTKFLTTNVKGTEREMYLPVNLDIDQLPFLRPAAQPVTVMNHPPLVRMEQRSIPPLGNRTAAFTVPGELVKKPGTYRLSVRLRSRAEPIYFMRFVGATQDMERAMNEGMLNMHAYSASFEVK
ncbi:cytochrome C [Permianibacter sp. IMCC34836]|uniref:multiheme c-type cytochrome n=1 Tax=Permianibacter fluminis TaxID=2738515 RepID=UPI0015516D17|nr:multiheme c-type cytochrome [Permianibacter fluminis]NQD35765.1 cytochrome C [Permianibacter fluminis]